MTLLTFHSKYVNQSTTPVTTTSSSYQDDTQATQTFTLPESKTVFALYLGSGNHGSTNYATGIKSAISIDGTEYCEMCQSPSATNYAVRNSCFWVGTLAAGSHTIKGRFCSITNGQTVTLDNHTLLVYVFNGDEFSYVTNTTTRTTATTAYGNLSGATTTITPSAACKALALCAITNDNGSTVPVAGYRMLLNLGGSSYTESEVAQSPFGANYPISLISLFNSAPTDVPTTFMAKWAANVGTGTCTVNRSVICVMLFDSSVTFDRASSSTAFTTTSTSMVSDSVGGVSEATTEPRELFAIAVATKLYNTSSSDTGGKYGLYVEGAERGFSTKSPYAITQADATCIAFGIAAPAAGTHLVQGRVATNVAATTERIGRRVVLGIYFPLATLLTFKEKYLVTSDSTLSASSNALIDDTYASQTFTLTASQTVLAFYHASATYGDTNNVAGFQSAISIDGADKSLMHDSGYAANYPMRNTCFWAGTLLPGEHTIKGRFASNVVSTNTSITDRALLIYVFDGNACYYFEGTNQLELVNDTYVDDTTTAVTITTAAASKALILYGVTNNHGTAESYLGKKVTINVNATDYTECQAMESSYSAGSYTDSVATAYTIALAAATNTFKGRVATTYATFKTFVDNRSFAVLLFDDSTLIDVDSGTTSQNTTSTSLVDDPDISVTRSDTGELLAFYMGCKRYLTSSSLAGNVYGLMIDGVDVARSRTSQAYSGSPNSCLVGYGKSVYAGNHTLKGRYASANPPSAVYITDRILLALWFDATPVTQAFNSSNDLRLSTAFTSTDDVELSKPFAATNDIRLSKSFSNSDDIELSKSFAATNDLRLSEAYETSNDIRLSTQFAASNDLGAGSSFSSSNDIMLSNIFQSLCDILVEITRTSSNDILMKKTFSSRNDIRVWRTFLSRNDIRLINTYSSISDLKLSLTFTSTSTVGVERAFSSTNYIMLSSAFESDNDILLSLIFSSFNAILATFVNKYFSSTNDILVNRTFESDSMLHVEKFATSTSDILVGKTYTSNNDAQIVSWYESSNDVCRNLYRSSSNDIRLSTAFSSASDIIAHLVWLYQSSNNILLSEDFNSSSDIGVKVLYQSGHDMLLKVTKSSTTDILVKKLFESLNDMQIRDRFFASSNGILLFTDFDSYSDIQILKEFASSNDIIYLHFDPEYPLTVIVSRDSRVIVIAGITNQVVINSDKRSTSVDSVDRTVTVSSQDRRVVIW